MQFVSNRGPVTAVASTRNDKGWHVHLTVTNEFLGIVTKAYEGQYTAFPADGRESERFEGMRDAARYLGA